MPSVFFAKNIRVLSRARRTKNTIINVFHFFLASLAIGPPKKIAEMKRSNVGNRVRNTSERSGRILYLDAYDSFSYNVISMFEDVLNVDIVPYFIDTKWPADRQAFANQFDAIVLGPGPGTPVKETDVGSMSFVWDLYDIPILGVCLGFQLLCCRFGSQIEKLRDPRHGRVVRFSHSGEDIFRCLPEAFDVVLYNSLHPRIGHAMEDSKIDLSKSNPWGSAERCPELVPLAWYMSEECPGEANLMAVRHAKKPFWGVQFHPESCKSAQSCRYLVRNWWELACEANKTRTIAGSDNFEATLTIPNPSSKSKALIDAMLDFCPKHSSILLYRKLDIEASEVSTEDIYEILAQNFIVGTLLESNTRYSIISIESPSSYVFEYKLSNRMAELSSFPHSKQTENSLKLFPDTNVVDVWHCLEEFLEKRKATAGSGCPFWGGFTGFFSYEIGLTEDTKIKPENQDRNSRDVSLLWTERSVVIDKQEGCIFVQSAHLDDDEWLNAASAVIKSIKAKELLSNDENADMDAELVVTEAKIEIPNEKEYKRKICDCQSYIRDGESYELCLTDETQIILPPPVSDEVASHRPWRFYKRLRLFNPGAFSGYAHIGHAKIVSSSPECFLQWDRHGDFEMKPMKGTVKKEPGMTLADAQAILHTPKEIGENLMIADLIRHDMARLCGFGTVQVHKLLEVEDHSRVYQMITHVKASPSEQKVQDMPKAAFPHYLRPLPLTLPPGSMTGAPKIRSCELLHQIEQRSRSVYSGVLGYLDIGGGGSFSVLIRAIWSWSQEPSEKEIWRVGAGGAVTALSTAQGEWDEMLTKLNTVLGVFKHG